MQLPRVHNVEERPGFRLLEETSATQDREARSKRRWDTLLAYGAKIDDAWLLLRIRDGRPVTWRRCKDRRTGIDKEQPQ
jgi:hypothetical protein